jgi:hypothetical protein
MPRPRHRHAVGAGTGESALAHGGARPTGKLPFDGLFPALIEWEGTAVHPAPRLPDQGVRLKALELHSPEAEALRAALAPTDRRTRASPSGRPTRPHARHLDTPDGRGRAPFDPARPPRRRARHRGDLERDHPRHRSSPSPPPRRTRHARHLHRRRHALPRRGGCGRHPGLRHRLPVPRRAGLRPHVRAFHPPGPRGAGPRPGSCPDGGDRGGSEGARRPFPLRRSLRRERGRRRLSRRPRLCRDVARLPEVGPQVRALARPDADAEIL